MMETKIHHLPDGRLKVEDHYITDGVAIKIIKEMDTSLEIFRVVYKSAFDENFPHEIMPVINGVLKLGSQKHQSAEWRQKTIFHHAKKAFGPLHQYIFGIKINSDNEDTLAHALTRLAMAVSVREEG